ncbi:MAG: YraN family protein [Eubacteriales bacterium]|nr:YraN family protein [Eubacteriales bacterium]
MNERKLQSQKDFKRKPNKRRLGSDYEEKAAEFLQKNGYRIMERNFRCKIGEIDLIARDGRYLVFIEVKYRTSESQGNALEAVNWRKQEIIRKVALFYLIRFGWPLDTPCRFDVVGITGEQVQLIKNAF